MTKILNRIRTPDIPIIYNKLKTAVTALFLVFSLELGAENANYPQYNPNSTTLNIKKALSNEDKANGDKANEIRSYIESNTEIQQLKKTYGDKFENLINQVIDSITLNIDDFASIDANGNPVINNQEIDKLINQILKNQDINHLSKVETNNLIEIIKFVIFISISFLILKKTLITISEEELNEIREILRKILRENLNENLNEIYKGNNDNLNKIIESKIDHFINAICINKDKYLCIEIISNKGLIKYKINPQNFSTLFSGIFSDLFPESGNEKKIIDVAVLLAEQINKILSGE